MKKLISLTLAFVMLISCCAALSSCSQSGDNTLDMATNASFPPYEYKDGDSYAGIDVEIAGKIAEKLGMELKIHDIEFNSILTGVQTGKYDMGMAGMTVNDERKQSVDFTDSYATGVQVVIVKQDSAIKSIDDLTASSCMIGTQEATTGFIYASDTVDNGGFGEERVSSFKTGNDAVQALMSNKVEAVIIDNEPAKAYVKANAGLTILPTEYVVEDYAICVAKDNSELLTKINDALTELKNDGTVQSIIDKYITDSSETAAN